MPAHQATYFALSTEDRIYFESRRKDDRPREFIGKRRTYGVKVSFADVSVVDIPKRETVGDFYCAEAVSSPWTLFF